MHPEFHSGILEFNFSSRPIYLNVPYMGKFWQLKELANHELFAKFSLPIFIINYSLIYSQVHWNIFGICTDLSLFAKFSLPIAFSCMVRQNFPVYGIIFHENSNNW